MEYYFPKLVFQNDRLYLFGAENGVTFRQVVATELDANNELQLTWSGAYMVSSEQQEPYILFVPNESADC